MAAKDNVFSISEMEAIGREAFEIRFENLDTHRHAVYIVAGPGRPEKTTEEAMAASSAFRGDYMTGPASVTYHVAALPAGVYTFLCPPHPTMTGTLTVR